MIEWKNIEPGTWKPKQKDDSITGVLLRKEEKTQDMSAKYFIENEDGNFLVWGCAILDTRLSLVEIGDLVRITYKGKTENAKGQSLNLYNVEVGYPTPPEAGLPEPTE